MSNAFTMEKRLNAANKLARELLDALIAARPYIVGAYECAFPDQEENEEVLAEVDAAIAKARGEVEQ